MNERPDIVIRDARGVHIAAVSVTTLKRLDPEFAADWHQLLLNRGHLAGVRYFLLVEGEGIHLWDHGKPPVSFGRINQEAQSAVLPAFIASKFTSPVDHYLMLLAVFQWFLRLEKNGPDATDAAEQLLDGSGFLAAIRGAEFRFESAA